jgi:predicted nucleic acid-binding protein
MILCDTSGLLALLDRGEPDHRAVQTAAAAADGPLLVTDLVLAETDYLVLRRLGSRAERAFVDQLIEGVFLREAVSSDDLGAAARICLQFGDQDLGLTDATLMALAERLRCSVLTLDRRHFTPFRDRRGRPLHLLP